MNIRRWRIWVCRALLHRPYVVYRLRSSNIVHCDHCRLEWLE